MKLNYFSILTIISGSILFFQTGCQKQTHLAVGPKITFEKVICDLGKVGPGTKHPCEFKFTNTGGSTLIIKPILSNCSCTIAALNKKEYAPGESGAIGVKSFRSPSYEGPTKQQLFVFSNDEQNPKIALTIEADVEMKIDYSPKRINLLLKNENAACPEIVIKSKDNTSFAIKRFISTANCITADVDPSTKKKEFVVKPKIDMEILKNVLNGRIDISLTHPECSSISIPFDTLPRFKIEPQAIIIYKAEPQKPVSKEIWVLNNYNEDFEIESTSSRKGIIKVLNQQKVDNRYKFELQITPPPAENNKRFSDTFFIKIKDGEELKIYCSGFYSSQ